MRVLIQTLGSSGDVLPFLELAKALVARGHEVRLWANDVFQRTVQAQGITWRSGGSAEGFEAAQANPDLWHPRRGVRVVMQTGVGPSLEPLCKALLSEIEPGRTLLVSGSLGLAARLAQEASGTPHATVHLAPCVYRSLERMPRLSGNLNLDRAPRWLKRGYWWLADRFVDPHIVPELTRVRATLGLAPVRRVFDQWLHSPDLCLGLWPERFAPAQPDWPAQAQQVGFLLPIDPTTWSPPGDLERWLAQGSPPVVVTGGSANLHGAALYEQALLVLRQLGRRAVVVTRNPAVVPSPLPSDVHHLEHAPFGWLFARASGLISHGGIGTTAQALACGIPHLVAAMGFDQFDNASRLKDLGVGDCLPAARFTARRAHEKLQPLLADAQVAERCRHYAVEVQTDASRERAVAALEALARARGLS